MGRKPRIAEVQCSRIKFEPGDRVLVRLKQPIEHDAAKKLRKAVEQWAGGDVEVLLVYTNQFDIEILKASDDKRIIT